jgi:hypothetical protein
VSSQPPSLLAGIDAVIFVAMTALRDAVLVKPGASEDIA